MNNLTYLFAAYTLVWLGLFAYILSLHLGQRQLKRRIDTLTEIARRRRDEEVHEATVEPRSHQPLHG